MGIRIEALYCCIGLLAAKNPLSTLATNTLLILDFDFIEQSCDISKREENCILGSVCVWQSSGEMSKTV